MANIATLLARILTTRYGNEMRQDLHDAIEAVNDDTETALGKKLTFTNNTRKLKLLAKDDTVLSEVVIPGGGSGGGSVDSVNGLFPDENGNVELNLDDINDVDITSVSNGDALVYDATSHKWVNGAGGGGTTDYTDLTNKPSINGVTLSGNKTSADLNIFAPTITSPTSGQVVKYDGSNWVNGSVSGGGSNRNLLDNPWFTVNQRGFTGTTPTVNTKTYFADRFYALFGGTGGSIVRNSDGTITLTKYAGGGRAFIYQKIENMSRFLGKDMTISLEMGDGTIYKVTRNTPTGDRYTGTNVENTDTHTLYIGFSYGSNYYDSDSIFIELELKAGVESSVSKTIKAMKLEFSAESTLALDTEPNYTEELLKCQRYFYPLGGGSSDEIHLYMGRVFQTSLGENRSQATIVLPTAMRTTPTFNGVIIGNDFNGNSSNLTSVDVKGVQNINISGAWGSTPTYGAGYIQFGYANQLSYLSAEL